MRSPRTATKSSPRSPQLEKAHVQQQRPNAAKDKKEKKKKKSLVFRKPLGAEKGKKLIFPSESTEETSPFHLLTFVHWNWFWTSHLQSYKIINLCCFKSLRILVISYSSSSKLIHLGYLLNVQITILLPCKFWFHWSEWGAQESVF